MATLTQSDLDAIRQAVAQAETETSGEIVPFLARQSDAYLIAVWKAGVVCGLMALFGMLLAGQLGGSWSQTWFESPPYVAVAMLAAGFLGSGLAWRIPALRRMFAGSATMAQAVHKRALQAFLEEEVFLTQDRTGILLFVSLFERRIEVLGDSGINAKVSDDEWGDVLQVVRTGIVRGELAEGLASGIKLCGQLLRDRGVAIKPDDRNELPDGLRRADD